MKRKIYDPEVKSAILEATTKARSAGKSWVDSFEAAKAAGYTGTVPALQQMLRNSTEAAAAGEAAPKAPKKATGKKRGRPKGATSKPRPAPAAAAGSADLMGPINAFIAQAAKDQVASILDRIATAIAEEKAKLG